MSDKVAIYCRLSEKDDDKKLNANDSESIQNQKAMLQDYVKQKGWEIYDIYVDDGYTGSDRNRPEFNRLIKNAKEHKFNTIICKTQSRFTREIEIVETYINELFILWGIRFIGVADNVDTEDDKNRKCRQLIGLTNEWYLEDMSNNIRSVLANKRKQGLHIGSFALYGYQKDPERKGHLIIDEEAAMIVRKVFSLFAQGYGKTAIAKILNAEGIPNPSEYKRLKGLRYKKPESKLKTLWNYYAISKMLINEIYIGNMVQGKYGSVSYKSKKNKPRPKDKWYRVENTHEPIIDKELWDNVQIMIKEKAKPFSTGNIGLFANKTRCMNCGYTMRSSKNRGKHYLKCSKKHISKDACEGAFIAVDKLEKAVIDELNHLYKQYIDKDSLEKNIKLDSDLEEREQKIQADMNKYKQKISEYNDAITSAYLDKTKGNLSENDYDIISRKLSEEREKSQKLINEYNDKLEKIREKIKTGNNRRKIIEQYTNLEHLNREIVEKLIDYISIGKREKGTTKIPIEIHWNF